MQNAKIHYIKFLILYLICDSVVIALFRHARLPRTPNNKPTSKRARKRENKQHKQH